MSTALRPDELEDVAPRVAWRSFLELFTTGPDGFKQGDHVTIVAPTGGGKTTLAYEVVNARDYVLGLFTKPRDPLIDELRRQGWRVTNILDIRVENGALVDRKVAYHPVIRYGTIREKRAWQARRIKEALDYAFTAAPPIFRWWRWRNGRGTFPSPRSRRPNTSLSAIPATPRTGSGSAR
jgi:hypothetical protein